MEKSVDNNVNRGIVKIQELNTSTKQKEQKMKPKSTKEKDISRLAVYLATYNDSKKIKNSMTEHGIYEFGRRLANLMNIDFR